MTRRDDVPDEIIDRQREDHVPPLGRAAYQLERGVGELAVPLIKYRLASDQQGGGESVSLLRCNLPGAEQLHAL